MKIGVLLYGKYKYILKREQITLINYCLACKMSEMRRWKFDCEKRWLQASGAFTPMKWIERREEKERKGDGRRRERRRKYHICGYFKHDAQR